MKPYYEADGITIFHGDCREIAPTLASMQCIQCIVTSPPYNQLGNLPSKGSGIWGQSNGGAGFLRKWERDGYEDTLDENTYQNGQRDLFTMLRQSCTADASLFYNHQLRWRDSECIHPIRWFTPNGWRLRQEIIWDRCGGMMFNARMFVRFDERILWFVGGDRWKWNQSSVGHGTIWRVARSNTQQGKEHPVEYPIDIPSRCIAATTDPGDMVLDPFMGSGTTLRAAKDLGRKAIGIEIEERYCEIAARRLAQRVLDFA